jgi:hypothetical protein
VVNYPERAADQNKVYDLADRIEDEELFRVKTDGKLFYRGVNIEDIIA